MKRLIYILILTFTSITYSCSSLYTSRTTQVTPDTTSTKSNSITYIPVRTSPEVIYVYPVQTYPYNPYYYYFMDKYNTSPYYVSPNRCNHNRYTTPNRSRKH